MIAVEIRNGFLEALIILLVLVGLVALAWTVRLLFKTILMTDEAVRKADEEIRSIEEATKSLDDEFGE